MSLLLIEIVARSQTSLHDLVESLLKEVGPAFYERKDLRLSHPVSKSTIIHKLETEIPTQIGGESLLKTSNLDGVKYIFADDSWLLIRPSGTEPVLRVYAEGRTPEMVTALLEYGEGIASSVV